MQLHKCSILCFPYIQKELIKKSPAICYIPTYKAYLHILLMCRSLLGIKFSYMHANLFFPFRFQCSCLGTRCAQLVEACFCDAQSCGHGCGRTGRALSPLTPTQGWWRLSLPQKAWLELICLPRARGRWGILAPAAPLAKPCFSYCPNPFLCKKYA